MKTIYLAYGSNMHQGQMARRCPTARVLGSAGLEGFKLTFRGPHGGAVANIEADPTGTVPVLLWEIQPADEASLDRYEGYPFLYRKKILPIIFNRRRIKAMAYIMNAGKPLGGPSDRYYNIIRQGYRDAGFDPRVLNLAGSDEQGLIFYIDSISRI